MLHPSSLMIMIDDYDWRLWLMIMIDDYDWWLWLMILFDDWWLMIMIDDYDLWPCKCWLCMCESFSHDLLRRRRWEWSRLVFHTESLGQSQLNVESDGSKNPRTYHGLRISWTRVRERRLIPCAYHELISKAGFEDQVSDRQSREIKRHSSLMHSCRNPGKNVGTWTECGRHVWIMVNW